MTTKTTKPPTPTWLKIVDRVIAIVFCGILIGALYRYWDYTTPPVEPPVIAVLQEQIASMEQTIGVLNYKLSVEQNAIDETNEFIALYLETELIDELF